MVLSPKVCYVCGSSGAVQSLFVRPFNKNAYFPFLESHDPPKGSRGPSKEGVVDSCNICFMFLHQQWESYESNRTPIVKRLYWLKRVDNQPFTGAEMKIQGEYAAQMMGLQYYPNTSGPTSPGGYDDESVHNHSTMKGSYDRDQTFDSSKTALHLTGSSDAFLNDTAESLSALDTSNICVKEENDWSSSSCFLCNKEVPMQHLKAVSDQYVSESEPFFPFLQTFTAVRERERKYGVCGECWRSLEHQWCYFNAKQTPIAQRCYSFELLKPQPTKPRVESPRHDDAGNTCVCYLCGQHYGRGAMKMLHTRPPPAKNSKHSIYFEFVCDLKRPEHAQPLDQFGRVVTCRACYSYLQRQWQSYQQEGVPVDRRRFNLRPLNDSDASFTSASTSFGGSGDTTAKPDIQQLKVQVPEPEVEASVKSVQSERLLAIATPASSELYYRMFAAQETAAKGGRDGRVESRGRRADECEDEEGGSWAEEEIDVERNANEEVTSKYTLSQAFLVKPSCPVFISPIISLSNRSTFCAAQ